MPYLGVIFCLGLSMTMDKICLAFVKLFFKGTYPIFWKLLFVDRFEQNLHSICKMKNKIYFARDIFPVFFLVFFLFTVLWTNCNKIVFTQIPKALSVLVPGKKQRVFWKAR